ncbi:MAG: zinc-ribbon domain-containing protein [Thermoplasmata archaeon]|nr:zinc-ribbon domain-containing protein [Thermoplasmata archaeon]
MRCPSCGREIPEGVDVCPHCGARVTKRLGMRALLAFSLALILVGGVYAALSLQGYRTYAQIGDLSRKMTYASVQVSGIVTGSPSVYLNPRGMEGISFTISDGTGELRIRVYGKAAQRLVDSRVLPSLGDRVEVSGTLLWSSAGYLYLSVNYADALVIREDLRHFQELSITRIASASPSELEEYSMVETTGIVTSVRPMEYLVLYTLTDPGSGSSVTLVMNGLTRYVLGDAKLGLGNGTVTVRGALKLYGTEWEVELLTVGGFDAPAAEYSGSPSSEPYSLVTLEGEVESLSGDPSTLPAPFSMVVSGIPVNVEAYAGRPLDLGVGDSVVVKGILLEGPGGRYVEVRALTMDGVWA